MGTRTSSTLVGKTWTTYKLVFYKISSQILENLQLKYLINDKIIIPQILKFQIPGKMFPGFTIYFDLFIFVVV